jgi:hypothetical protein
MRPDLWFDGATPLQAAMSHRSLLAITDEASPFALRSTRIILRGEQCAGAPLIRNDQARSNRPVE